MVKDSFELARTDSFCPSPPDLLLDYVRRNDVPRIQSLVRGNEHLLSHIYDYPHQKTILQICCCKEGVQPAVVEALVSLGANLFFAQEVDNMRNALHIAAQYATPEILRSVVKCMKQQTGGSINDVDANGNTALHIVVKEREEDDPYLDECARILVESGIDVNKADSKGHTAILWAAKSGLKGVVQLLLRQSNIDIDSHKLRNKTARQWITEKRLVDEPIIDFPASNNNQNPKDILFSYLNSNRESDFVNHAKIESLVDADDGVNTLLQLACKSGLKEAARHLLDNGADPNHTTMKNKKTPLEITSELGYHEIFDLLLKTERVEISNSVTCNLFKYMDRDKIWISDYEKCYRLLRDRMTHAMVNDCDADGNTPLHYAVFYSKAEDALDLLDLGASLGNRNGFDVSPVQNIHADLLERHLDRCIRVESSKDGEFGENCVVTFDYRTLVPQTPETAEKSVDVEQNPFKQMQELVAETEVVSCISQSGELRHLLKHPVLSSFLFMKWHRIRWFFYTNLTFYLTFCSSLILYILLNCAYETAEKPAGLSSFVVVLLSVSYVVLILRELFQMAVSPSSYFLSFENWVEICLIAVTLCIFLVEEESKQFSAIAVLLATFELTMLVGQHPKICTNVVMLRTVSFNFFKILLWFSVLILAFAFSFYVLFHQTGDKMAGNSTSNDEGENQFFDYPGLSIVKTIVMLTGEFDASSMNFTTFPLASPLIFLSFVFMITIILFNLLNGLAVSDTQMIKNDAELIGLISRAQHVRYIESMILGNILPTSILRLVKNFCCCLPIEHGRYLAIPRILAEKVCLFPHFLPDYVLRFYPLKGGELILDYPHETSKCFGCCSKVHLDGKTVRRSLEKVHRMKAAKANGGEVTIKQIQERIERLQQEQSVISKKLELILQHLKVSS